MPSSPRSSDDDVPHGTIGGYTNHDCHCDRCSAAWAEYMAGYRSENRAYINARRRALRRANFLRACGHEPDLEALIEEEVGRDTPDLT